LRLSAAQIRHSSRGEEGAQQKAAGQAGGLQGQDGGGRKNLVHGLSYRLLREPCDFVLEVEFASLEFRELQIVGAEVSRGIRDLPLQRPVLLFEVGQVSLTGHWEIPSVSGSARCKILSRNLAGVEFSRAKETSIFRFCENRRGFVFGAFSSREPVPTLLENALSLPAWAVIGHR
jgi:hypothetical protein